VTDCIFCKIAAREIPATVVYETADVLAFHDIAPKAPVHVLVIPKAHHSDLATLANTDPILAGTVMAAATAVAEAEGIAGSGYRTITNTGAHAGMEVPHVHVHVLGGAPLGPMLAG
jgi:histidine triad (HIT) family protein